MPFSHVDDSLSHHIPKSSTSLGPFHATCAPSDSIVLGNCDKISTNYDKCATIARKLFTYLFPILLRFSQCRSCPAAATQFCILWIYHRSHRHRALAQQNVSNSPWSATSNAAAHHRRRRRMRTTNTTKDRNGATSGRLGNKYARSHSIHNMRNRKSAY